jgi:ubiquinone/menaquinone biosynthesis C-methylase UbiE
MLISGRSQYKNTWTHLASTYDSAVAHVIGQATEAEINATARQTVHYLQRSIGIFPSDTVLEIGCGIGRVGALLAPDCDYWIGCDVAPPMLIHARQRLATHTNVRLVEVSGYDLIPISDASVDVVYCTVVFMHLDEWERYNYVCEAHRVLRPGGRLFIDNFSLCTPLGWEVFEQHWRIPPLARPAHVSKSSTPSELRAYLEHAYFEAIEVAEEGMWVQAWAKRPHTTSSVQGLIYDVPKEKEEITIAATKSNDLRELHELIDEKNAHIETLEAQIAALEARRSMRLPSCFRRVLARLGVWGARSLETGKPGNS